MFALAGSTLWFPTVARAQEGPAAPASRMTLQLSGGFPEVLQGALSWRAASWARIGLSSSLSLLLDPMAGPVVAARLPFLPEGHSLWVESAFMINLVSPELRTISIEEGFGQYASFQLAYEWDIGPVAALTVGAGTFFQSDDWAEPIPMGRLGLRWNVW